MCGEADGSQGFEIVQDIWNEHGTHTGMDVVVYEWSYESDPLGVIHRADAEFIAAANPVAVLALIADSNRLESEAVYAAAGFNAAREEIAKIHAEVAGLRTGYEAYEQVNAELKAEVEALRSGMKGDYDLDAWLDWTQEAEELRKDAEQWRALVGRAKSPVIGYTGCVICGAYTDHGGLPCPKTRAAANALAMENQRITPVEPLRVPHPLDAALGQGEQS
ncbi:hypothetical protein SAMN04490207_6192 [Pseudomonas gessardii]|nr:hypothetical protein SAMN04490207_6192 [Pseudomonas gessardii]